MGACPQHPTTTKPPDSKAKQVQSYRVVARRMTLCDPPFTTSSASCFLVLLGSFSFFTAICITVFTTAYTVLYVVPYRPTMLHARHVVKTVMHMVQGMFA